MIFKLWYWIQPMLNSWFGWIIIIVMGIWFIRILLPKKMFELGPEDGSVEYLETYGDEWYVVVKMKKTALKNMISSYCAENIFVSVRYNVKELEQKTIDRQKKVINELKSGVNQLIVNQHYDVGMINMLIRDNETLMKKIHEIDPDFVLNDKEE